MKISEKNKKRILWAAVLIIVPSFVLWGSMALRGPDENIVAEIKGNPIKHNEFLPYLQQAQLHWLLNLDQSHRPDPKAIHSLAGDFYLLIYQARQENIKVSDQEVIDYIQNLFLFQENGRFSPERYQNFIENLQRRFGYRFTARNFEEYARNTLKREKLFNRYTKTEVTQEEVKEAYVIDNQKAKLSYLLIPYESFVSKGDVPERALKEYYNENKDKFWQEPKIKVSYVRLQPDTETTESEIFQIIHTSNLSDLDSIEVRETDFFGKNQPIQNIGFNPQINQILFTLEKNEISSPLRFRDEILIFQKTDQKEAYLPEFSQIQNELKEAYRNTQAKQQARKIAEDILLKIKTSGSKDLSLYSTGERVKYQETDFFKYFDYIRGLGISEEVSNLVFFQLKEKEVYQKPIAKENGIYILKLEEKTEIDPEQFAQEKEIYYRLIKENKQLEKRLSYLDRLSKELSFRLSQIH